MKSQKDILHKTVDALLSDVHRAYPEYGAVERDRAKLALLCQTRGLGLFTLDLPSLDNLLLEGIESGRLSLSGPLVSRKSKKIQVPKFLSGLWLRVFDTNSCLREDFDVTAIAFLRQIFCIGKKSKVECSPKRLKESLDDYYDVEKDLRFPSLDWTADVLFSGDHHHTVHFCDSLDVDSSEDLITSRNADDELSTGEDQNLLECLQRTADDIIQLFRPFDPVSFVEGRRFEEGKTGFRHGPGAVADMKGKRGLIDKFAFKYWPQKLHSVFPSGYCIDGLDPLDDLNRYENHEAPARLHAVPKTAKGPRLIASEPVAHQWCQQLMLQFFVEEFSRLFKGEFITLSSQEKSQKLVASASASRKLATIDLSSASDRLSCWTVERIFRRNPMILTALHACRTRWLVDEISQPPRHYMLKKFASQGTAVTFPVQSLVFLICSISVQPGRTTWEKIQRSLGKVRIFGDDIIIPNDGYAKLERLLSLLQLKVNVRKSFHKGFFRESCGSDCVKGYDVTPCKPQLSNSVDATAWYSLIDLSNNLYLKGYWNASEAVRQTVMQLGPLARFIPVIGHAVGAVGFRSYSGGRVPSNNIRWNASYQRYEAKIFSIKTEKISLEPDGHSALRRFIHYGPPKEPVNNFDSLLRGVRKVRKGLAWVPATIDEFHRYVVV